MPIYIIYYIIVYKVIWYHNRALDLPLFASGTIFNGGPRTETKFRKWALSLKRLRTAALDTDRTVLLALEHDNIYNGFYTLIYGFYTPPSCCLSMFVLST